MKKDKTKIRKSESLGRPAMAKISVCLPSVSVERYIRAQASKTGRSEADMVGWLLEAAFLAASNKSNRRLFPKKQWKLKQESHHTRISVVQEHKKPLHNFIRRFCSKEHLMVGELVAEMLLAALEAFQRLPRNATLEQLVQEITKKYLK